MNILEETAYLSQFSIYRSCSDVSTSTNSSKSSDSSPTQVSAFAQDQQHLEPPLQLENLQMIEQKNQPQIDLTSYLKKRKNVMGWLQRYGSQLNLSRNALSAAHQYAEIFYHNTEYQQKRAKIILTCLLILASKQSDYKILFTNHIAYICSFDPTELNQVELQCCNTLAFDFASQTYAMVVDRFISLIKQQTSLDLYAQQEQKYVILRLIHGVVQKLFTDYYEWQPNQYDILEAFIQIFQNLYFNQHVLNYLRTLQTRTTDHFSQNQHRQIKQAITNIIQQFKQNKIQAIKNLFQNRRQQEKYTSYQQFAIKFYE